MDKQTVGTLVAEEGSECSVTGRGRVSAVSEKRHVSTVSSITGRRDALISWLSSPAWRRQTYGWQRENTCRTQCGVWRSDVTLSVINVNDAYKVTLLMPHINFIIRHISGQVRTVPLAASVLLIINNYVTITHRWRRWVAWRHTVGRAAARSAV